MNSFIQGTIIAVSAASLSFGIAFSTQIKIDDKDVSSSSLVNSSSSEEEIERKPLTPQQKFVNSLGGIQGFDAKANIDIKLSDTLSLALVSNIKGDASELNNIKLDGDADIALSNTAFKVNFAYFDSTVFFDFRDSYFKMDVDNVLDFASTFAESYGISFNLPSSLTNFSLENFENILLNMPEKELSEEGYVYKSNLTDDIIINWKSNENDEFTGLNTSFVYEGIDFTIDVSLVHVDVESLNLCSPLTGENKDKYQDFSPAFTLFDGLYSLTKKKRNTVNADIKISKDEKEFLSTNTDISYDLDNSLYSLSGDISINNRNSSYGFALYNETIYADYSSLHVSLPLNSVPKLVDFFFSKIGNDELQTIFNSLTALIENPNVIEIVSSLNNCLGSISLSNDELKIALLPSLASDKLADMSDISLTIHFSQDGIESIDVSEFSINGYKAKVKLAFKEYKEYSLSNYEYQSLEVLTSIPDVLSKYSKQSQFAIEFDGKYCLEEDGVNKELTIGNDKDGNPSYIQFTLDENRNILDENGNSSDNGFGYGQVSIVDYDGYLHNVKVDLKSVDEVLFSYNSSMNGKMKIQTLKDLYSLVKDITIDNPDDHMKEIVNKIFDSTTSLPLNDIINGDYSLLLTTNIINSLEAKDNYLKANISLDILSMSHVSFDLIIEYESGENPSLNALKFSNLNIDGITENKSFEFNAYLKEYDVSKDNSSYFRLDRNANYIDFGDLKVLLELGINTSKYNFYHFAGNAHLNIASFFEKDLPLDIKVWSKGDDKHNSDVEIDIYLSSIPTLYGFNGTGSRNAHIYYHNNMFYVDRSDEVTEWFRKKTYNYAGVYTTEYFFDNILKILLQNVMGFNDTVYGWIDSSANENENYQIPYEKILKDFKYNEAEHNFYFDLDIEALSGNSDLDSLTITARADASNIQLVGVDVHLGIKVGINISLDLSLNLKDDSSLVADDSNRLTNLESFESSHKNDSVNTFRQL